MTPRRVALVTGSAAGLMRGVCVALARRGYGIAANYRPARGHADETVAAVRAAGGEIAAFAADVSDCEQAASLVANTQQTFGRLDILVAGAGPLVVKDVIEMTPAEFREMMDGNVASVYYCARAALPIMRAQRFGRIITFSMIGSDVTMGVRHMAAHAAAKAAVVAFTRSLALEEGPYGITCNTVAIGDIRDKSADRAQAAQRRDESNPVCRPGSWEDVADAVAFFARDESSFITGAVLHVGGGWQGFLPEHARWP
jgi:3-oxoacyl-[acyl-carrier protein] reductase